ncbi:restriction endonuclease subunit S [Acinetobacter junii]|uniref:restriction endonuclease subunit S n=1 Tax=Acinetobacter junii TaxID=40215 RepID=UPI003A8373E5
MKQQTEFGEIPLEWEVKQVIEIKDEAKRAIAMGPFGSNIKAENFVESGVPVIRGTNMNFAKFVDGEFVFLTEKKADELLGSNCHPDDLVFTHRGTIGQVALIPKNKYPRYVISQSGMKLTVNQEVMDSEFLFYFFKSEYGQYQILKYEAQVGVPSISNPLTSLKQMCVPVPPLPEQKAIASVLSSLDDKIDLLHRQNKTLEAMAETLFRQWFIEEAKEDWEAKSLDAVVSHFIDYRGKTPNKTTSGIPLITAKIVKAGRIQEPTEFISNEDYPLWMTRGYPEINDVVLTTEAPLGEIGLIRDTNVALAQRIITMRCDPNVFDNVLLKYYLMSEVGQYELDSRASGTTVFGIKASVLKKLSLLIPPLDEQKTIAEQLHKIEDKMYANEKQVRSLSKLRDTLLPKLMSGEVRVQYQTEQVA